MRGVSPPLNARQLVLGLLLVSLAVESWHEHNRRQSDADYREASRRASRPLNGASASALPIWPIMEP